MLKKDLREDLWKSIQTHYDNGDYTEAIRDCIFCLSEALREKSGFDDKDGSKLVDSTLLGQNPVIKINKNETVTERDEQQGVGFAFKGLMLSVRNRISHEKTVYSKKDADAILLYSNYLLNLIDQPGTSTKMDDILELLFDEDFTQTEEYAKLLLKEIPKSKRYDLLLKLYYEKEDLPQHCLRFFIKELLSSISKTSLDSFCRVVDKDLIKCKDNHSLRMYIHYFMNDTYSFISRLAQSRFEDLIYRSIRSGQMETNRGKQSSTENRNCNAEGSLGTWVNDKLSLLINSNDIIDLLYRKTYSEDNSSEYVFNYFENVIINSDCNFTKKQIEFINKRIQSGHSAYYKAIYFYVHVLEDESFANLFGDALEYYQSNHNNTNANNDIPF